MDFRDELNEIVQRERHKLESQDQDGDFFLEKDFLAALTRHHNKILAGVFKEIKAKSSKFTLNSKYEDAIGGSLFFLRLVKTCAIENKAKVEANGLYDIAPQVKADMIAEYTDVIEDAEASYNKVLSLFRTGELKLRSSKINSALHFRELVNGDLE